MSHKLLFSLIICFVPCPIIGCNWDQWQPILTNPEKQSQPTSTSEEVPKDITIVEESKPEPIITSGEYKLAAFKTKIPFILWVPWDYDPEYLWPVIFCYHGAGGSMTTWPFSQITGGRGFIIVGMSYVPWESNVKNSLWLNKEKSNFLEVLNMIKARLNIDTGMIFMGGYSQGGYHTTLLGEQELNRLAGLIILGAGRAFVDHTPPSEKSIKGKPVFIGVGENDTVHNPRAKKAAQNYERWGAKVTFEEWPGVGHGIGTSEFPSKLILNWLEGIFAGQEGGYSHQ